MMRRRDVLKAMAVMAGSACATSPRGTGPRAIPAAREARPLPTPLRESMIGHVASGQVPGLVAVLDRDGGELHLEAFGTLQLAGQGGAMAPDTIFRISSMTKPITAAAALILVEEGELPLDAPVHRWLPELSDRRVLRTPESELDDTVPATRPITVLDVLTSRLGTGQLMVAPATHPIQRAMDALQLGQGFPQPAPTPPPDEWMKRLGSLPLIRQPGETWMYNTGSDVLGVLVARASGQRFEVFLEERIFGPLGMLDTAFWVPPAKLARFADSYAHETEAAPLVLSDSAAGGQWCAPPAFPAGSSGLVSTAPDFLGFARMLRSGGERDGRRILAPETVAAMTRDQLTPEQKAAALFVPGFFDTHGWGYGLSMTTASEGGFSRGAYGWDGGLGTSWTNDPGRQLTGILLTQRASTSPEPTAVVKDFWEGVRKAAPGG